MFNFVALSKLEKMCHTYHILSAVTTFSVTFEDRYYFRAKMTGVRLVTPAATHSLVITCHLRNCDLLALPPTAPLQTCGEIMDESIASQSSSISAVSGECSCGRIRVLIITLLSKNHSSALKSYSPE